MKIKKIFIIITVILLPICVSADDIDKEYLDNLLTKISDNYSFNSGNVEELLLLEVDKLIPEKEIEKEIVCDNNNCQLKLIYSDIVSDEKNITVEIVDEKESNEEIIIINQSHVQNIGWNLENTNSIIGTTGHALQLEAFKLFLDNVDGSVVYRSYVAGKGWEEKWQRNGEISGTIGKNRGIEAIRINLEGNVFDDYDIYYRAHVSNIGWLGWTKNGEIAGTIGYNYSIEAIEVKLVTKNEPFQEMNNSYKIRDEGLLYSSHNQNVGWQKNKHEGESGQAGKHLNLEAIRIKLTDLCYSGNIEYDAHIENIGWQGIKTNGNISGTTGKNLHMEALKINLTGEIAEHYDIYYRVYNTNFGWLGWAKNGEVAGSTGMNIPLEGYELKLVEKGTGEETGNSIVVKDASIKYQTHVKNKGDQQYKKEGETSGTTGKNLWIEGIRIELNTDIDGHVLYKTKSRKKDWEEEYAVNGDFSGTIGEAREIQNIRIKLDGELADRYDIYYRVHSSNYGWLGWAKNDEIAGVNHYQIEAIQIKLYLKNDLSVNKLNTKNHYIEFPKYKPIYYNQKDLRWSNISYGLYRFGGTGCLPTSLAMAFSGILHKTILPTEVGNYLYYNTDEFDKRTSGSSGQAVILASKHYDINYKPLKNAEEIKEALKQGKIVSAAMGAGRFANNRYNHEIIVYDYSNGKTYAYDPLKQENNGWVSIEQLIREQSKDSDDSSGGSNFYSLERY